MRIAIKESDVQSAILDFCEAHRIFVRRRNVGAMKIPGENGKKERFITFNDKAMADLWGIRRGDGRHWECEVKRPGEVPRDDQWEWLQICSTAGALTFYADSIEMFMEKAKLYHLYD